LGNFQSGSRSKEPNDSLFRLRVKPESPYF
jgi:hypothetical protein